MYVYLGPSWYQPMASTCRGRTHATAQQMLSNLREQLFPSHTPPKEGLWSVVIRRSNAKPAKEPLPERLGLPAHLRPPVSPLVENTDLRDRSCAMRSDRPWNCDQVPPQSASCSRRAACVAFGQFYQRYSRGVAFSFFPFSLSPAVLRNVFMEKC